MLVVDAVSVARYRRIDQIGEQDRQSPDLTSVTRGGEQIVGLGVAPIDREYLIGQRRRCHPIATVNRRHRTIQQLINRCNPTFAHVNSVPLPAAQTRHIAGGQLGQPDGGPRPSPTCASGPSIRRGCGVGRRNTGVRLAANTERTGALKTGTADLHARAPVVFPAQLMDTQPLRVDRHHLPGRPSGYR
jgi:hypothetical protein